MLVTLVIRLVPERAAAGSFVGQVEDVGSGRSEVVHAVSDLIGFAQRAAADLEKSPTTGLNETQGHPGG